jgi:Cu2+-exporting ATPase
MFARPGARLRETAHRHGPAGRDRRSPSPSSPARPLRSIPDGPLGAEAYFDSLTMFVSFLLAGRYLAQRLQGRGRRRAGRRDRRLPTVCGGSPPTARRAALRCRRLRCGDRVRVPVGEAFPADGAVLEGSTAVDEALLTGESRPVEKGPGDEAIAGSLNLRAPVLQRVDRLGADTRYEGIVALLPQRAVAAPADPARRPIASPRRSSPACCCWPRPPRRSGRSSIRRVRCGSAVAVLIVTCPCALSLAAPVAYLAAAGVAGSTRRAGAATRGARGPRHARHRLLRQDRDPDRRP